MSIFDSSCPATAGDLYDYIEVGGVRSPGVVRLAGHFRAQNFDVKESDGQKGATTTWKGTKIGKFTATFSLVADFSSGINDFVDWDIFAETLWQTIPPKSGAKPVAKDISHPDLQRNGYQSVILDTMGELVHDGKGGATIAVIFTEYFPPKAAKSGGASGSKAGKKDPNDPIEIRLAKIDQLKNQAKKP